MASRLLGKADGRCAREAREGSTMGAGRRWTWGWCVSLALGGVSACDQPPYIPPLVTATDTSNDTAPCTVQPTLSSLKDTYFEGSCVFSGCHDKRSKEGGLDLESAGVHAQLVGVPSQDDRAGPRGKIRVVAGDPASSFMVQKVEGTMARDEGAMMPDGTDEIIDPECRVKMLKQWIADGALDN